MLALKKLSILFGISWPWLRKISLGLIDGGLILLAANISMFLRFENGIPPSSALAMISGQWVIAGTYLLVFVLGGSYRVLWRYAGVRELVDLTWMSAVAGVATVIFNSLFVLGLSRAVLLMTCLLGLGMTGGTRFAWRIYKRLPERAPKPNTEGHVRTLIVGAGSAGVYVLSLCEQNPNRFGQAVAFVDDDPRKLSLRVQNIPVKGTLKDIPRVVEREGIRAIIIALPSLSHARLAEVLEQCNQTRCQVRMLTSLERVDQRGTMEKMILKQLDFTDFLSRPEVRLDIELICEYISGKTILVTGGGGSIGSELARQIIRFQPARLILLDIYENGVYELERELASIKSHKGIVEVLIGSIRDKARLQEIFAAHRPQVVFHAAAHKHVPLMEKCPAEAIKNNVFGTRNLLEVADEYGVERLVQLSTDKAVNPSSVMGATKRVTEMMLQDYTRRGSVKCVAVRFGNVLGSHGSVVPLFESQIKRGGPVTVMHPEITRYFMTIPEAAQLVLQAGGFAEGGTIYVLDMGEPIRILDLAEKLIRFYGYEPHVDIPIQFTGLRPGEKLYEELMMDEERDRMRKTAHDKIFVAPPLELDSVELAEHLSVLEQACRYNDAQAVEALRKIVETFSPDERLACENKTA